MRNTHQRGIAIGPILFVVALLAVLASAVAAGSGSFNSDTSAVSAKAQATAILEYANEVKFAVDRLLGKGCKDTEISFENNFVGGYENPNAPSDKSCHVFDVNGGGIVWKDQPKQALDSRFSGHSFYGKYIFTSTLSVKNIGNWQTNTSLIMMIPFTKEEIAIKINEISNISGGLGSTSLCDFEYTNNEYFVGSYSAPCHGTATQQYGMGATANVAGHTFGCMKNLAIPSSELEANCFVVLVAR